jgi:hypothetical protein
MKTKLAKYVDLRDKILLNKNGIPCFAEVRNLTLINDGLVRFSVIFNYLLDMNDENYYKEDVHVGLDYVLLVEEYKP